MKMSNNRKKEVDMLNGPLLGRIVIYTIPLLLSGLFQLFFNAADIIVVGRFAGAESLAAVGSTSSLINLLVNLFMGFSVGTNVLVARFYGAGQKKELSNTVHTAIVMSAVLGLLVCIIGIAFSRTILIWMGSPEDVLDLAVLYIKIYFLGIPASAIYNFGGAILRAIGDTKRPMYFLTIAGVINVGFNLIFVIVFKMGVAGVGLATTISQIISASCIVVCLLKTNEDYGIELSKLRIHKEKMIQIIKIGLPAGMQGALFSFSNVLIQSSVNSFGSVVMAGNTAAQNIEGFVYMAMNSVAQTAISFTSQNYGAKKFDRVKKVAIECLVIVFVVGFVLGEGAYIMGEGLLGFYSDDKQVIAYGMVRLASICVIYFLCGIMDVMVGIIRGLGYSVLPMIVSLLGACAFRIVWLYTIFKWKHTLEILYLSYATSWLLTIAGHAVCFSLIWKKLKKANEF